MPCIEVSSGNTQLDCDDRCVELRDKKLKDQQVQEEVEKNALLKQQQEEVERFERKKQGGRKRRKNRQVSEQSEGDASFLQKYGLWFFISLLVVVLGLFGVKIIFLDSYF